MGVEDYKEFLSRPPNNVGPYWHNLEYNDIVPHGNPEVTAAELTKQSYLRYNSDMTWYDRALFGPFIHIAKAANNVNRSKTAQWIRRKTHTSLPPASTVVIDTKRGERIHDPTPWELEMSSYSPSDLEVQFKSEGAYKVDQDLIPTTLIASTCAGVFTQNRSTFNGLFNCVRDEDSQGRIKFRNVTNPNSHYSAAVLLPNGRVKVIQMIDGPWSQNQIHAYLTNDQFGYNSYTLDELKDDTSLDIQFVVDCSGESIRRKVPAYTLLKTPHTSITYNMETGEVVGSYIHSVADGTAVKSFFMQTFYDMERHYSHKLPREKLLVEGSDFEQFCYLSDEDDPVQMIGMEHMPQIRFHDRLLANMHARSKHPITKGQSALTFTASNNYPRPNADDYREQTGQEPPIDEKLFNLNATVENRISIGQEQYSRHAELMRTMDEIQGIIQTHFGDSWPRKIRGIFPSMLVSVIPRQLLARFYKLRDQSHGFIAEEIKLARQDKTMSAQIMNLFHGRTMSWGLTKLAQTLIRRKFLGNVNGSLVSQMLIDEGIVREKDSPSIWFRTITPDSNQSQLTTLIRAVLTNANFIRRNYKNLQENMDRDPITLIRATHVLSWKDKDPKKARRIVSEQLGYLFQSWILMDTLVNNRPEGV